MKRIVKSAQMHEPMFVAGLGEVKKTISAQANPGSTIHMEEIGVVMNWKGVEFLIPTVNFKNIVLEPLKEIKEKK